MSDEEALDEEGKVILRQVRAESAGKVNSWLENEVVSEALNSHGASGGEDVTFLGTRLSGGADPIDQSAPVVRSNSFRNSREGSGLRQVGLAA